jgi:hypothetical protein
MRRTVSNKRNYEEELDRLMSFLAESVAQMSDSEITKEYSSEPRTKEVFKATLKDLRKEKLREARAAYDVAARGLSLRLYDLPSSNSERRVLLSTILSRRPDLGSLAFTAQHRELKDLTDSDVESFLRQLAELGLLDLSSERE